MATDEAAREAMMMKPLSTSVPPVGLDALNYAPLSAFSKLIRINVLD
jgi:hypothetical protein